MTRVEELRELLHNTIDTIQEKGENNLKEQINLLKDSGIYSNMHLGCNENREMEQNTEESEILRLEWLLGSLINIVEQDGYWALNNWENIAIDLITREF